MQQKTHFILPPNEFGQPCQIELIYKIERFIDRFLEPHEKPTIRPPKQSKRSKNYAKI